MSNATRPEDAAALDEPIEAILVDIDDEDPTSKPSSPTSVSASHG